MPSQEMHVNHTAAQPLHGLALVAGVLIARKAMLDGHYSPIYRAEQS